ncbi:hypothetical protein BZA70DRAFT_285850 [Myxozyma melibiosi]|uniref:Uncharacterized protein n=1 Tax=Myxozyma melibiosi TaxID=54550 RepID=A0ABR1EXY3_9ASCO
MSSAPKPDTHNPPHTLNYAASYYAAPQLPPTPPSAVDKVPSQLLLDAPPKAPLKTPLKTPPPPPPPFAAATTAENTKDTQDEPAPSHNSIFSHKPDITFADLSLTARDAQRNLDNDLSRTGRVGRLVRSAASAPVASTSRATTVSIALKPAKTKSLPVAFDYADDGRDYERSEEELIERECVYVRRCFNCFKPWRGESAICNSIYS